jgi:hypothetical protein
LHQTYPLGAIARRQHKDPAKVLAALKTVTAAWDEGKVILHLVGPLQASKDVYLTLRAPDRWSDAPGAHAPLPHTPSGVGVDRAMPPVGRSLAGS